MNARTRALLILFGLPLLLWAAATIVMLAVSDRLPDPLASHFAISGEPDQFSSLTANLVIFSVIVAAVIAGMAAVGAPRSRPAAVTRAAAVMGAGITAVVAGVLLTTVLNQVDLADAADARLSVWVVLLSLVAGVVAAVLALVLVPRPSYDDAPVADPDAPRLALPEGARVMWMRSQAMAGLRPIVAAAVVAGIVTAYLVGSWLPVLVAGVVTAALVALGLWTITVDARGVHCRAVFGLPRRTIALDRIVEATVVTARPLQDAGGWGIRLDRNGSLGLYLRGGQALRLQIHGAAPMIITVDDAATAAGLVNTLRDRNG